MPTTKQLTTFNKQDNPLYFVTTIQIFHHNNLQNKYIWQVGSLGYWVIKVETNLPVSTSSSIIWAASTTALIKYLNDNYLIKTIFVSILINVPCDNLSINCAFVGHCTE